MSYPVDIFFNTGLESSATLTTVAGGSSSVLIHFWNDYEAQRISNLEFDSSKPLARIKSTDVALAVQNDTIIVDSTTYYISDIQHDGLGIALLTLSLEQV